MTENFLNDPRYDLIARGAILQTITLPISVELQGANAATAANYGHFFIANRAYRITGICEVHTTAASGGTLQIEKLTSGTAPGSGANLLATAISLTASANTPQFGSLTMTKTNLLLKKGDSLALKVSGLTGSPADVDVTIYIQEI